MEQNITDTQITSNSFVVTKESPKRYFRVTSICGHSADLTDIEGNRCLMAVSDLMLVHDYAKLDELNEKFNS